MSTAPVRAVSSLARRPTWPPEETVTSPPADKVIESAADTDAVVPSTPTLPALLRTAESVASKRTNVDAKLSDSTTLRSRDPLDTVRDSAAKAFIDPPTLIVASWDVTLMD